MADIYKGELQDNLGNTVYPHTESDVVFCSDGKTVQEKMSGFENVLGDVTGTSGSLEVSNENILATTEATKKLKDNFANMVKFEQTTSANFTVAAGKIASITLVAPSATYYRWTCLAITTPSSGLDIMCYSGTGTPRVKNITTESITSTITWSWVGFRKDVVLDF